MNPPDSPSCDATPVAPVTSSCAPSAVPTTPTSVTHPSLRVEGAGDLVRQLLGELEVARTGRGPHDHDEGDHQRGEQQDALDAREATLQSEGERRHRRDGQGRLASQQGAVDPDGGHHGSHSEHQREVRRVRADDVADPDRGVAASRCEHRHQQLRQAGAQTDDDGADDDRRHPEAVGQADGAVDEAVRGAGEHDEPDQRHQELADDAHRSGSVGLITPRVRDGGAPAAPTSRGSPATARPGRRPTRRRSVAPGRRPTTAGSAPRCRRDGCVRGRGCRRRPRRRAPRAWSRTGFECCCSIRAVVLEHVALVGDPLARRQREQTSGQVVVEGPRGVLHGHGDGVLTRRLSGGDHRGVERDQFGDVAVESVGGPDARPPR